MWKSASRRSLRCWWDQLAILSGASLNLLVLLLLRDNYPMRPDEHLVWSTTLYLHMNFRVASVATCPWSILTNVFFYDSARIVTNPQMCRALLSQPLYNFNKKSLPQIWNAATFAHEQMVTPSVQAVFGGIFTATFLLARARTRTCLSAPCRAFQA